jgi:hypothetical protein
LIVYPTARLLQALSGLAAATHIRNEVSFTFNQGVSTTTAQCDAWTSFLSDLPAFGIQALYIRGTHNTGDVRCDEPAAAQQIADALHALDQSSFVSVSCNGVNWSVGFCIQEPSYFRPVPFVPGGPELVVGTRGLNGAACRVQFSDYTTMLQPCDEGHRFGGVNRVTNGANNDISDTITFGCVFFFFVCA